MKQTTPCPCFNFPLELPIPRNSPRGVAVFPIISKYIRVSFSITSRLLLPYQLFGQTRHLRVGTTRVLKRMGNNGDTVTVWWCYLKLRIDVFIIHCFRRCQVFPNAADFAAGLTCHHLGRSLQRRPCRRVSGVGSVASFHVESEA